ncbi:MAG: ABC transporter ATP-binding protein [Candidatus Promineifilaceae bacterium]|jgi:energy-coupling factor transport system ATP-binding protein
MDEIIQLRSVTYTYPNRRIPALHAVNLDVKEGEFVLVTGPSGSGKSTMLRTLNGLVPHFSGGEISGDIVVKGVNVIEAGPQVLSNHVGFVAQNPEAQTILETVEPEIAFALENAAVPRVEMHKRVQDVLDYLDLIPLRSRPIISLSGGERQRVAIACALALQPDILVLDEPTSQLDPQAAAELLKMLKDLNRDLGLTIVLAEHRLERTLPFVDSLAYFEDGRLVSHDSVRRALVHIPQVPPLIELARNLKWEPAPLTISEAAEYLPEKRGWDIMEPATAEIDSSDETILQVEGLRYSYNQKVLALDGIDFQLHKGEILAVMGANGSGKSTLLRCIIGLLQPLSGDVLLKGRSVLGQETVDLTRRIAYLPQYPDDLLFAETVRQELEITLDNHEIFAPDRVDTTLQKLSLAPFADYYPRDLSTGQRQRTALGAITVAQPDILLLDEPTRGQDGLIKSQLLKIWQRWKSEGMGLIIVSHDVELVAQLADRVMILADGKIEAVGSAESVLSDSSLFAPQIARLFPGSGWLTVEDALNGLAKVQTAAI